MDAPTYEHARRSDRSPHKIGLTLLGKVRGLEFQEAAHTVNVSKHGLCIRTEQPVEPSRCLAPGQVVYIYGPAYFYPDYARVVWVQNRAAEAPSEAGLEFLN